MGRDSLGLRLIDFWKNDLHDAESFGEEGCDVMTIMCGSRDDCE